MSQAGDCGTTCCDAVTVTEIPGAPGLDGDPGAPGTDGINAFTITTLSFDLPNPAGPIAGSISVGVSSWMSVGQIVIVSDTNGTDWANIRVDSIPSATTFTGTWLGYPNDAGVGHTFPAGSTVSPSGEMPSFSPPSNLTDSTGAVGGSTLQPGSGVYVISIGLQLSDLTNNIIAVITPGHAFRIINVTWANNAAGGAAGAAVITPTVSNGTLTGGVITLGATTTVGAVTPGTAATQTFANASNSVATITLTASGVTTYTDGDGSILVYVQNTDTINAIKSLNDQINLIITQLS